MSKTLQPEEELDETEETLEARASKQLAIYWSHVKLPDFQTGWKSAFHGLSNLSIVPKLHYSSDENWTYRVSDAAALRTDWEFVGADFRAATKDLVAQLSDEQKQIVITVFFNALETAAEAQKNRDQLSLFDVSFSQANERKEQGDE